MSVAEGDAVSRDYELPAIVGKALYEATFPEKSLRSPEFRIEDAEIALEAIPNGWVKVDGAWRKLERPDYASRPLRPKSTD